MRLTGVVRLAAMSLVLAAGPACAAAPPAATPAGTPGVVVKLSAYNSRFDTSTLSVPAGATYAIDFDNRDGVPHNVAIVNGPAGSSGEIFSGPGSRLYVFPGLAKGTYAFHCDVHPDMSGTVTAS
jgi:plastocyanin